MWASFHCFTVNEQQLLLRWLSSFTKCAVQSPLTHYCRILQNVVCRTAGQNSKVGSILCSFYGLDYWPQLWNRRSIHCYCWTYLLKHIQQIHRIQRKRWHFAVQHRHGVPNVAPSSLSISASVKWTVLSAASHAVHPLQQRCLLSSVGAFCLSFWSHIKKHVHTLSTFLLDWSIFFLLDITFILTSVWLQFICLLGFWSCEHVPTSGQKKSFFPFFNL